MSFTDKNGFSLINEEQKIRITLSERARITIAEDMAIFQTKKATSFINTVFSNYKTQARASISNYLQKRKLELEQLFSGSELDYKNKLIAIEQILSSEEKRLIEKNTFYLSLKGQSKLYHFSKIHHRYVRGKPSDYPDIMGNEHISQIIGFLQLLHQVQYHGSNRYIQC